MKNVKKKERILKIISNHQEQQPTTLIGFIFCVEIEYNERKNTIHPNLKE